MGSALNLEPHQTLDAKMAVSLLNLFFAYATNIVFEDFLVFVDLVKVYATINHHLLIKILQQCGATPKLCNIMECMHRKLIVVIKVGKEERKFSKTVGVRQWNNRSPLLFVL